LAIPELCGPEALGGLSSYGYGAVGGGGMSSGFLEATGKGARRVRVVWRVTRHTANCPQMQDNFTLEESGGGGGGCKTRQWQNWRSNPGRRRWPVVENATKTSRGRNVLLDQ